MASRRSALIVPHWPALAECGSSGLTMRDALLCWTAGMECELLTRASSVVSGNTAVMVVQSRGLVLHAEMTTESNDR